MNHNFNINCVVSAFQEAGWKPVQTNEHWLLIPVEGKHISFFISFYFNPDNKMLAARGNIPVHIPQDKELIILKLINYGNYKTPIGNFELDIESQQVFFRVGMFFENIVLNPQLLHNVVHEIYQAVQDFQPVIQAVINDVMSIEDAFELANSN